MGIIKKISYIIYAGAIVMSILFSQCQKNSNENNNITGENSWFKITRIGKKTWRIDDNGSDNIYLAEGDNKALLIDTGYGRGDLGTAVRNITKLPVTVVNTHNHPDHTGGNSQFAEIYAHPLALKSSRVKPVREGYIFDLGNRKLEVIETPGHTPGSIVLLDAGSGYLFTGDTNNRHVWLFLSNSLPLTVYLKSLQKLQKRNNEFGSIFPGHGDIIDKSFIDEQVICVTNIISGKCIGKKHQTFIGSALLCTYKRAGVVFDKNKIK